MNITRLFVGRKSTAQLTHVGSGSSRVTRSADELAANVAGLSAGLLELGVRSGSSVLILGSSRVEIAEAILATFNIGAIAVPVSPLLGPAHLISVISRMRPKCCLFEDPPEQSVQRVLSECGSAMIAIKATAESAAPGWKVYREIVSRRVAGAAFPEHPLDHPALIVHGSGSSGKLKPVTLSHGELLHFLEYNRLTFSQYSDAPDTLESSAPTLNCVPLTHLAGLGNMLVSLTNQQRTFLLSSFVPETCLRLLEEARCSHILLVPSLYRSLLKEPYLSRMDKSSLRFCIIGGEPSPCELLEQIEQAFGVPVVTAYGMTECLTGIAHLRRDLFARVKPGSCGRQLFGEISLRDAEGKECSEFGELWVRNPTVHRCYLDPSLNEERLRDGWFRTGDLFFRDRDGDFFHRGRADDMFICNGKNIYPIEIEQLLASHPAVETACASVVNLPGRGSVPGAMVVARATISEAALQEFFMQHGPSHAVPQVIRLASALPLLGPGKIDRRRVKHLLEEELNVTS